MIIQYQDSNSTLNRKPQNSRDIREKIVNPPFDNFWNNKNITCIEKPRDLSLIIDKIVFDIVNYESYLKRRYSNHKIATGEFKDTIKEVVSSILNFDTHTVANILNFLPRSQNWHLISKKFDEAAKILDLQKFHENEILIKDIQCPNELLQFIKENNHPRADFSIFSRKYFDIKKLKECLNLRELNLCGCIYQVGENLLPLKGLPLRTLNLQHCILLKDGLAPIVDMPLKILNLSNCWNFIDKSFVHLKNHQTIEDISLDGCGLMTDDGIVELSTIPSLLSLSIAECVKIEGKAFLHFLDSPLTKLNASSCCLFEDKYLVSLKNLKELNLSVCPKVTGEGLSYLKNLESLNLSHCSIDDMGLKNIKDLPLKSLTLAGCKNITDEGLFHIENTTLEMIDFSGCPNITIEGIKHLITLPLLKHINLDYTDIPQSEIDSLYSHDET